ncbi:MAG: 3'-5' exonuclease, partial [Planctomycetota bacterium]
PGVTVAACEDALIEFVRALHRVSILTIDSFFIRLASGFEFEMGLPPGWRIEANGEADQLKRQALESLVEQIDRGFLVQLLRQLDGGASNSAVRHSLLDHINKAYGIFLLCPDPKPWWTLGPEDEITQDDLARSHLSATVGDAADEPPVWESATGPDKAWVEKVRACELPKTKAGETSKSWINGVNSLLDTLHSDDPGAVFGGKFAQAALEPDATYQRAKMPADLAALLRSHLDPLREKELSKFCNRSRAVHALLRVFHENLEAIRCERGAFGFDDVTRALAAARATSAGESLYFRIDSRIDHILLDEFQDTSIMQFYLLMPLIEEIVSGLGREVHATTVNPPDRDTIRTFFCVGDVKQSLYEWRDAQPELLPQLSQRWEQIEVAELERNWRSSPIILRAADAVFDSLLTNSTLVKPSRQPVYERYLEMRRNQRGTDADADAVADAVAADELLPAEREVDEPLERAALHWQRQYRPNVAHHRDMVGWFSVRVAERYEHARERASREAAERAEKDEQGLTTSESASYEDSADEEGKEGSDLSSFSSDARKLCCLETAADRILQLREKASVRPLTIGVLFRRRRYISTMIEMLRQRGIPASEEGGNTVDDAPAVAAVLSLIHLADFPDDTAAFYHVCHMPLGRVVDCGPDDADDERAPSRAASMVRRLLTEDGYVATLSRWITEIAHACSDRELRRLNQLLDLAESYEGEADLRPSGFLAYVQSNPVDDPALEPVRVMTIHASKGLEFDYVVLPELDQKLLGNTPSLIAHRASPLDEISVICRYPNDTHCALDPRLIEYRDRWKQDQIQQALCGLYVAMTRAKRALECIICPVDLTPKGNARTVPVSFAGILRGAFASGKDELEWGEELHSLGDPEWWEAIDVNASDDARVTNVDLITDEDNASQAARLLDLDPGGPLKIMLARESRSRLPL